MDGGVDSPGRARRSGHGVLQSVSGGEKQLAASKQCTLTEDQAVGVESWYSGYVEKK